MDWQKIKERVSSHIETVVASLITSLFLIIWRAVPSETWARVLEAIPKQALAASIALLVIALATATAYIFTLRRKLKSASAPSQTFISGIKVGTDGYFHCSVCDVPLNKLARKDENDPLAFFYQCPKCQFTYRSGP
jgi:MFS superfamily sulfate permease-like transporter